MEDPVCVCVCVCACVRAHVFPVPCISEDERIWQHQPKKNCCPQTKNLPALVSVCVCVCVCVYACMHVGVCVHLSVFMCVCKWVDTLSQKITGAECFFNQCSASSSSECPLPWCLSVCACSCVHFYDLKQILLAMIFLCGELVRAPWRSSELGPGADSRPAATWLSGAGGGLVVQLFPQAHTVLSDHPVSHIPLANMLREPILPHWRPW